MTVDRVQAWHPASGHGLRPPVASGEHGGRGVKTDSGPGWQGDQVSFARVILSLRHKRFGNRKRDLHVARGTRLRPRESQTRPSPACGLAPGEGEAPGLAGPVPRPQDSEGRAGKPV